MRILHLTTDLIARVDRWTARFHGGRMGALAALPGNPFGVEVRLFGSGYGVACKVRHLLLRGKNRIHGFCPDDKDILSDLLTFYWADGLSPTLTVPPGWMTEELFLCLTQARL